MKQALFDHYQMDTYEGDNHLLKLSGTLKTCRVKIEFLQKTHLLDLLMEYIEGYAKKNDLNKLVEQWIKQKKHLLDLRFYRRCTKY